MSNVSDSKKAWEASLAARTLEEPAERKLEFTISSSMPLDSIYVPDKVPVDYEWQLGLPSEYPYARGV